MRVYHPLSDLAEPGRLPFGDMLDEVLEHVWLAAPDYDATANEGVIGVFIDNEIAISLPGVPAVQLALGATAGGVDFELRAHLEAPQSFGVEVPLSLRVDAKILRPLKPDGNEPDLDKQYLNIVLGSVKASVDTDGHFAFDVPGGVSVPRCMVGSTGVIVAIGSLRWLTPNTDLTHAPNVAAHVPENFTGLYLEKVTVEIAGLPIRPGQITLEYGYIGTGGFTGAVGWSDTGLGWNGSDFENGLHGNLLGFKGGLSRVKLGFRQNALTECEIGGNIFVPYLDRVIGLSLGLDGIGGLTAVASVPTCVFTNRDDAAKPGPAGYLVTADTPSFTLDISELALRAGGDMPALLSISGRAKLKLSALDLPAVVFKKLSIDTEGHVAVEGGWLDVDAAKSAALKGFPFQITKIGFGAEADGTRWVGLNGGLKLADGLPMGASVEGLRVGWNPTTGETHFALKGVGVSLRIPDVVSLSGQVAFFSDAQASGFKGSVKLCLETIKLTLDASLTVARGADGTSYFYLYLDAELPTGVPLFATGAAVYGLSGLVADNLRPDRSDGEDWYYGYYKRAPVGVTDVRKWTLQEGSFAIGLGATIGSLPDAGFAFSAKSMLVLALPGPQLLLQGKGQFLQKMPDHKNIKSEGSFDALLVLDVPGRLFQAHLAAAFNVPGLVEISGGVDVAFSWANPAPADTWHVYLGEKTPVQRRLHATLLKLFKGDSWLMINRPGYTNPPDRKGDLELGGAIGMDLKFDFTIAKAWLSASIYAEAVISRSPQQFDGLLDLRGSAGLSVFGASLVAELMAQVTAHAPTPWYVTVNIDVALKIDLVLFKKEFRARLPLEFGDRHQPLPAPVTPHAVLWADHAKSTEARLLASAVVPPDVRPVVVFQRPVQDLARFGAPGRRDVPPDELGQPGASIRQASYRLQHVALLSAGGATRRLVAAAGEVRVSGNKLTFEGVGVAGGQWPDLAGMAIGLFKDGQPVGAEFERFAITSGGGTSATVSGQPPQGARAYRLTQAQAQANVTVARALPSNANEFVVELSAPLDRPTDFTGGLLQQGLSNWMVLEAQASTLRLRREGNEPSTSVSALSGPAPILLEGQWAPTGDPVTGPDSSTRLQVWARTPFDMYRCNERESLAGLPALEPGYGCGPAIPDEQPAAWSCTRFDDLVLSEENYQAYSSFVSVLALRGRVKVQVAADGQGHVVLLGRDAYGEREGSITFDVRTSQSVTVTASCTNQGVVRGWRGGAVVVERLLQVQMEPVRLDGNFDWVEVTGNLVRIRELCTLSNWHRVLFDSRRFPNGLTNVAYGGLAFESIDPMVVQGSDLVVRRSVFPYALVAVSMSSPATRVAALFNVPGRLVAMQGSITIGVADVPNGGLALIDVDAPGPAGEARWVDRVALWCPELLSVRAVFTSGSARGAARSLRSEWAVGVQRSVQALYQAAPVLAPGAYELRAHTAAVVTGEGPNSFAEVASASFAVGAPLGAPSGAVPADAIYPAGGPLTRLATYVNATVPPSGERHWYRLYDTGVLFNEAHVVRMFLETQRELRVSVANASGMVLRDATRQIWSAIERYDDAWTTQYVRTLNGDGTDACATVDMSRVVRPERVTAGEGELLDAAALHVCWIHTDREPARQLLAFEFSTSRYASFGHHAASFDGRCQRLTAASDRVLSVPLSVRADAIARLWRTLGVRMVEASAAARKVAIGMPTRADYDADTAAQASLSSARVELRREAATVFEELWALCGGRSLDELPTSGVRVRAATLGSGDGFDEVWLVESPEPLPWQRLRLRAALQRATIPLRSMRTKIRADFGKPDAGFEVEHDGIRWRAGVELRVVEGQLRPRAGPDLDVTLLLDDAISAEIDLVVDEGGSATVTTDPAEPEGPRHVGPGSVTKLRLRLPPPQRIASVRITGKGTGVSACTVVRPFIPMPATGPLRFMDIRLPTARAGACSVTLIADRGMATGILEGWRVLWNNARGSTSWSEFGRIDVAVALKAGQRMRLLYGPAEAEDAQVPTALDVIVGGRPPPVAGALFRLQDATGRILHETASLANLPADAGNASMSGVVAIPMADDTRAFLVAATGSPAILPGTWTVESFLDGAAGLDMAPWSVAGEPVKERCFWRFTHPPSFAPRVRVTGIVFNPAGSDLQTEHVEITNTASTTVDLTGWTLRDTARHVFKFPSIGLAPGQVVRVWTKSGRNVAGDLFWGYQMPIWNNAGDTVMLRDRTGRDIDRVAY